MIREAMSRYGHENLGFFWVMGEPLLLSTGIAVLWTLIGQTHGFDIDVIPFALTGYSMITMWRMHVFRSLRAMRQNVSLVFHSNVQSFDILLARGLTVRMVTLPDGDDPDTFVASQGAAAMEKQLGQALDVFDRKVQLLERGGWFTDLQRKRRALDRLLPIWQLTSEQDWDICQWNQQGVSSSRYVPGRYSTTREQNVAHFVDWYLREVVK